MCTHKNNSAPRCLRRTFLSKWSNKEPLASEETFDFIKVVFLVGKEGFFRVQKDKKEMFFKEPLIEWFFVEPKIVILWHRYEEPF